MRTRAHVAALAVAIAACSGLKPTLKVKPFPYQGYTATYPSGMRLVAYELKHMPEVMISASYRVGTIDDPPGKEGLAHLVEHLTFRARPGRGARIWDRLDATGVAFNGVTSEDSTDYYAIGRVSQLDTILEIEAARLADPLAGVDEREFRREREVVVRELAQRRDPAAVATQAEWVLSRALPGSPYARTATAESLRAIALEDARAFVRAHYTPAHLIVTVTGPTAGPAVGRAALATFGDAAIDAEPPIRPVAIAPPVPPLDRAADPALAIRDAPVDRPVLWLAWTLPGEAARAAPRAIFAADVVESLVAYATMPHVDRVVSFRAFAKRMDGVSLAFARIELRRTEDAQPVLDAVRSARRFFRGLGGTNAWTRGRRDTLLMEAHLRLEALEVLDIAHFVRTVGSPDYIGGWSEEVAASLDEGGVGRYLDTFLRDDRIVALLVRPGDAPSPVPSVRVGGEEAVSSSDHHGLPPDAELPPGDLARAFRAPSFAGAHRQRLSNGLEVVVAHRDGFRAVQATLVVRTGPANQAERLFHSIAFLSTRCMVPSRVQETQITFAERVPTDLLDDAIETISCRAGKPYLDAMKFDRVRDAVAKSIANRPPSAIERTGDALLTGLYPDRSRRVIVTEAEVRAFRAHEASRWLEQTMRPDRATLILTGDVEPTPKLLEKLEARFGGWRRSDPSDAPAVARLAATPDRRRVVVVARPGWPTTEIHVGVRVPPRAARDEPAFDALVWRLDHDLNARLRIAQTITYGVDVSVLEQAIGASLVLSTVVERDRTAGAVADVLGALASLGQPFPEATVARARWQVARRFSARFGTSERDAARLSESFVRGLPRDEWDTFLARTAGLTSERIAAQAGATGVGREVIVVAGDPAALVPALRARGLAPEVLAAAPAAIRWTALGVEAVTRRGFPALAAVVDTRRSGFPVDVICERSAVSLAPGTSRR